MGNPLRFYGTDETITINNEVIPPRCAVEVTFRVAQQHFLLRPDSATSELIKGCFGRAFQRYPELDLHVLNVLSNHGSFLVTPKSAHVLSNFMRDFKSVLARKLNCKHDREGVVWERRYRAIPVLDEAALEDRFRYILTQGTKENLVYDAREWPGVTSIATLLGGPPLVGLWRDRETEYERNRQRCRRVERAAARNESLHLPRVRPTWIEYPIKHVPLPHWRSLTPGRQRARVARILNNDTKQTRARHERDSTRPTGIKRILKVAISARPKESKKSPAPRCHASRRAMRRAFAVVYRRYVEAVRSTTESSRRFATGSGLPCELLLPPLTLMPTASRSTGPPK